MCLTDEVGCEVVVVRVLEQLLQETHQVAEHITVGTGQLWDQLKRKERGKKIGLSMTLKWKVAIFPQLWKSKLSKTEQGGLGWGLMRSPVCRGGYRGHSPDIVGRVRNTRPAPARPPRRSIVLRPLSGCNRLNESVKEEQKKKKSTFQCVFLFAVPERSSLNAKCLQKYSNNGVFTLWKHNPANTTWRFLTNYTWLVK